MPELMDELVEEILLRVAPDDPASLVHAALVCKRWCRLVSDSGFRRRFREFHRAPPVLGFLRCRNTHGTRFVPTYSFRPPYADSTKGCVLDARHGRILLLSIFQFQPIHRTLLVSNPITGKLQRFSMSGSMHTNYCSMTAAFLCASPGCDHSDCGCLPFCVVFVGTDVSMGFTSACVYSSQTGVWSETTSVEHSHGRVARGRSALVGNAIYFIFDSTVGILEYDLGKHELSVISPPSVCEAQWPALMATEDGGLGFAYVHEFKLYMCSRVAAPRGWARSRVIELKSLLPVCALSDSPNLIAITDCSAVIIIRTRYIGIFAINLKSGHVTNVGSPLDFYGVVPYVSFCTPAL